MRCGSCLLPSRREMARRARSSQSPPWLAGFSKRQVEAATAGERMLAVGQGRDAVEGEPGRAAPHDDVAALEPGTARPILAARAAEEEHRRQPERDRDDGRREVAL